MLVLRLTERGAIIIMVVWLLFHVFPVTRAQEEAGTGGAVVDYLPLTVRDLPQPLGVDFQNDVYRVRPRPQGQFLDDVSGGSGIRAYVVRGSAVDVELETSIAREAESPPFPAQGRYRYVLHAPGENGEDIEKPLSSVLVGPQTMVWDSATVPDGAYALDAQLTGGGTAPRWWHIPVVIIVDNVPGPVTAPQYLPFIGHSGQRDRFYQPTGQIAWIRYPGRMEQHPVRPYPHRSIPPPASDTERHALLASRSFFAEPWTNVWEARYDAKPAFLRTKEGHILLGALREREAGTEKPGRVRRFPYTDGGRNNGSATKEIALRGDPAGPGYVGIGPDGRLVRILPDKVETLAGYVTRSEVVPYLPYAPYTNAIPPEQFLADQWQLIGTFEDGVTFEESRDLVFDESNPNVLYVADSGNHRIAKVELGGNRATVSTLAGQPGKSGIQDGERLAALFNAPRSIQTFGDSFLYVADTGNDRIRLVHLKTGAVSTVHTMDDPALVRRFTDGIVIAQAGTGAVFRAVVDPESGAFREVRTVLNAGNTLNNFDVDYRGNVGPINRLIYYGEVKIRDGIAAGGGDHNAFSIDPDTKQIVQIVGEGGPPLFYTSAESFRGPDSFAGGGDGGAYGVGRLGIHPTEASFAYAGQYQRNVVVHRLRQPDDPHVRNVPQRHDDPVGPSELSVALANLGRDVYFLGTIPEFFHNDAAPSLALNGRRGHTLLGSRPTFDDLRLRSDAELAAYIREEGMGTGVPRPEISGKFLQGLIYFIRLHSLQGKTEWINPQTIEEHLRALGLFSEDGQAPAVTNVQVARLSVDAVEVSWDTDEPALGLVHYGDTLGVPIAHDNVVLYGYASPAGTAYATRHRVVLRDLYPTTIHFQVRVTDLAGNLTATPDMEFALGDAPPLGTPAPPPPPAPPQPSGPSLTIVEPVFGLTVIPRDPLPIRLRAAAASGSSCLRLFLDEKEVTPADEEGWTFPSSGSGMALGFCPPVTAEATVPAPTLSPDVSPAVSPVASTASPSPAPETAIPVP